MLKNRTQRWLVLGKLFIFPAFGYLFLLLPFLSMSCQRDKVGGVITYVLPWPDEQGEYHLEEVEIKTLNHADRLEGAAAKVYLRSGVENGEFTGDIVKPRLTKKGSRRYMATDFESALAISIYKHFEKLQELDRELGIESQLPWPRRVGIQMNIRSQGGGIEHSNAHYVPQWDAILISPTHFEGLPMALNAGIIAHEHFHAHFQAMVVAPLAQSWIQKGGGEDGLESEIENQSELKARQINLLLLRAWNEGMADFWGYLYSGDPTFMDKTYKNEMKGRRLDKGSFLFPNRNGFVYQLKGKATQEGRRCGRPICLSYQLGSRIARLLKNAMDIEVGGKFLPLGNGGIDPKNLEEAKKRSARRLISGLARLKESLLKIENEESVQPGLALQEIFLSEKQLPSELCKLLYVAGDNEFFEHFRSACVNSAPN